MATYLELLSQIEKLKQEAETLKQKEIHEVIDRIRHEIEAYGLSPADLGFKGPSARVKPLVGPTNFKRPAEKQRQAKYRDSDGNVWSGRGPRPDWLKKALAAGVELESLRVR